MFIKRTFALLLICFLCLFLGVSVGAQDTGNMISNPSFETLRTDNGYPTAWIRSSSDTISTNGDEQYVHSGNYSLKFTQSVSAYPYARTTITGVQGGYEYTFGVWVLTMNKNVGIRFRYTCFSADETWLYDAMGNAAYNGYTGTWYHFTEKFRPPRGTVKMYLQLRISSPGTAYFDDVTMSLTDGPEKLYDFRSDSTFIYSEKTGNGTVSAKIDTGYYPALAGRDVNFSLYKANAPDKVLKKQVVKVPSDGNVSFSYPVSILTEKLTAYTVKCSFKPPNGEEIIKTHNVYKVDKPTHIDKDGFFRDENKEIFTPSIMYGVNPEHLQTLQKAGVNAVQGSNSQTFLDTLHEHNMKCFVVLYGGGNSAGSQARLSTTIKYVKDAMEHPAVFGWLIFDEPNATKEDNLAELETAYLEIRKIDPHHPVVITANNHYDVLHQYTDAIIQDSYPYNNARFTTYPYERNLKAVKESDGRPVYHLMQTFEHLNSYPKPQEVRNMIYASLWAGCKGWGAYKYKESKADGTYLNKTELWAPMVSFAENEQNLALDMFIHGKYKKVRETETDDYHWGVWEDDAGECLVLLRNKKHDAAATAEILLSESGGVYQAEPIGGSFEVMKSGNGKITVSVGRGDVALFRLTKALFLDAEGSPIATLSPGMRVNIISAYEAKTDADVWAIIALYQSTEKGEECIFITMPDGVLTGEENGIKTYSINETITVPCAEGTYRIKVFYWNRNLGCMEKAAWIM